MVHGVKLLSKVKCALHQELRNRRPQSSLIFMCLEAGPGLAWVTKIWTIFGVSMLTTKAGSKLKIKPEISHNLDHSIK